MIEFSKIKEMDYNSLLKFLNENNIDINEVKKTLPYTFIIKENKEIYGIGVVSYNGQDVFIEDIYVTFNQRNQGLGEGLLRSILHYGRINKVKKAYYRKGNKDIYDFLLHIGFQGDRDVLHTNIESFFSRPCNNSR